MPIGRKPEPYTPLTRGEKRRLGHALHNLTFYLGTSEGADMFRRLEQLCAQIENRMKLDRLKSLTPLETCALKFIQAELKKGHSPTVREVGKAIGKRSSRTGYRVMLSLQQKGLI